MIPLMIVPATCELCGQWMPQHSGNCPRNGVHPSQWSIDIKDDINNDESDFFSIPFEQNDIISPFWIDEASN